MKVLNNIYILFLIVGVVLILIGKLLYLTLYQIVRYIYIAMHFYIVHNILQRIFLYKYFTVHNTCLCIYSLNTKFFHDIIFLQCNCISYHKFFY